MLHEALDRAVKERLIPRNPCEDCVVPQVPEAGYEGPVPGTDRFLLEAAQRRDLLPMFYLELVSGLRKGELVALRWDDLDVQGRTISVSRQYIRNPDGTRELTRPKTENSVRLVSIPQTAVDLLIQEHDRHPENVGHGVGQSSLFCSRNSGSTSEMIVQITIRLVSSS